jgi:predicted nuclease with TOPRIM domain
MAVSEIGTYGKVLDERTTSEDVTERYIDLKARLNNLQMEEQSLVELLAKTKTVDEILRVEQELARVRGEVESLQGQINYLDRNVAMSLITVSLR